MRSENTKSQISATEANQIKDSWKNCLPGNLSNLFYYLDDDGVHRFDNYFQLAQDGIDKIIAEGSTIRSIRIYMGCEEIASANVFAPLLSIVISDEEEYFYKLEYVKAASSTGLVNPDIKIPPGITDLFQIHWDELTDTEVADAFAGVTYSSSPNGNTTIPPITRRVKFYDFPEEDVILIANYLTETQGNEADTFLKLLLGAGLTVRLTHPFNFRPIIAVPLPASQLQTFTPTHTKEGEAYFERSRPCPPFCNENLEG